MQILLTKDRPVSHRVSSAALQNLLAGSLLTITGTKLFSSHCGISNLSKLNPNGVRMKKGKGVCK